MIFQFKKLFLQPFLWMDLFMEKLLLLGDEAIAQGAVDAGMSGIYAYPGTPSTEITEYVQQSELALFRGVHHQWSSNEKTALEAALGMSYAGKRAMACMKHVGLNVAADVFMNAAITGVNGGLVIAVADDPSMHSSQNEQDSRYFGKFAMVPVFEPSNQQEAYEMIFEAFQLSENEQLPILMRITTRLAHSRSIVSRRQVLEQNPMKIPQDPSQFVLLPAIARKRFKVLLDQQPAISERAAHSEYNKYYDAADKALGIIACGLGYNYFMESLENNVSYPHLKIGQYPAPVNLIRELINNVEKVLVIEDGYPFLEEQINGLLGNEKVMGRLDGTFPRDGEMTPDLVKAAMNIKDDGLALKVPEILVPRPPALCKGCSHIDMYESLNKALERYSKGRVFSDIGCYTLGALEPYKSINSCVDMGASITMAKGASDAGLLPSVAVIGDSTFTHSGMTGLLDAVNENTPMTIIISDNSTTGMTGGQDSPGTGRIENICKGIGVEAEHVIVMNPLKKFREENTGIILRELNYEGVSVIISQRECIQSASRKKVSTV